MGVNDGASDVLQIGTTAIDTSTLWQATSAGEITQPLQPSFLVTDGTGATDVTGDVTLPEGTEMVMPGDTVSFKAKLVVPIAMEE